MTTRRTYNLYLSILLCVAALLGPTETVRAQSGSAAFAEPYLRRDVGGRAIGMAGAYTAVSNEPTALYYNAAGLAFFSSKPQFTAMYTILDFGRQHNYLAYGQSFNEFIGVGIAVNNFRAGAFTARDVSGAPLGEYTNQQLAAQGAFAVRTRNVGIGISGKYLLNNLDGPDIKGDGWALDIGLKMQMFDLFSVGLAAQNITGELKWNNDEGTTEKIPFTIRAGVAAEFGFNPVNRRVRSNILGELKTISKPATSYLLISLEGTITEDDESARVLLGLEYAPGSAMALRGGFPIVSDNTDGGNFLNFEEFGFGLSFRILTEEIPWNTQLDYAISKDYIGDGDLAHHISFIVEI